MKWINLAHDRDQWRVHIKMVRRGGGLTSEQLTASQEGLRFVKFVRWCSFLQLLIGDFLSMPFLELALD